MQCSNVQLKVARIKISTNKRRKKSPLVSTRQETVSLALEVVPGWPSYCRCNALCPPLEAGWRMQGVLVVTWRSSFHGLVNAQPGLTLFLDQQHCHHSHPWAGTASPLCALLHHTDPHLVLSSYCVHFMCIIHLSGPKLSKGSTCEDMSVNPVTAIDTAVVGFCSKKTQPRKGELGTTFLAKFLPHLVP